ncbi:MAG: alpha/beta hydrolase [Desulfobacterales bacterium]|nr:alpha/beta hydrolase [Desulfobacterales bacterium]
MTKLTAFVLSRRHLTITTALLIVFIIYLSGCATNKPYEIELMPAPDVYEKGLIDPFNDRNPLKEIPYEGILYATDRRPSDAEHHFYLNKRGHLTRLGSARVEMGPEGISWEEARRMSLLKNRTDNYPLKVVGVEELGILDRSITVLTDPAMVPPDPRQPAERYAAFINAKLNSSRRKDIFIYVHGYKVVFENPLLVATELWHFLGYDGVFIAYAWPSTPSRWAYFADIETGELTAHNLRIFLKYLAEETEAERIHIIGYSAGTRVVLNTLLQLAMLHAGQGKPGIQNKLRIGHVVLIGSDFDRQLFFEGYVVDGLLKVPETLSVYVSKSDRALGLSRWLFRQDRLGQMPQDRKFSPVVVDFLRQAQNLQVINVTEAEGAATGNGHAYFRKSPWVSSDILVSLLYNMKPAERGLEKDAELPIWTFPSDYIQKLRVVLMAANPELPKDAK